MLLGSFFFIPLCTLQLLCLLVFRMNILTFVLSFGHYCFCLRPETGLCALNVCFFQLYSLVWKRILLLIPANNFLLITLEHCRYDKNCFLIWMKEGTTLWLCWRSNQWKFDLLLDRSDQPAKYMQWGPCTSEWRDIFISAWPLNPDSSVQGTEQGIKNTWETTPWCPVLQCSLDRQCIKFRRMTAI